MCIILIVGILGTLWALKVHLYYIVGWYCNQCRGYTADVSKHHSFWYTIHDSGVCFWLIIDYSLPLTLMIVMNVLIIMALRRSNEQRKAIASGHKQQNKNDETMMIVAVVIAFIVIETPNFMIYVYHHGSEVVTIVRVVNLSTNAINFIIYAMFGKKFREQLKLLLCE